MQSTISRWHAVFGVILGTLVLIAVTGGCATMGTMAKYDLLGADPLDPPRGQEIAWWGYHDSTPFEWILIVSKKRGQPPVATQSVEENFKRYPTYFEYTLVADSNIAVDRYERRPDGNVAVTVHYTAPRESHAPFTIVMEPLQSGNAFNWVALEYNFFRDDAIRERHYR